MDIGKLIARERKKKGFTREKLAELAGVTTRAVEYWEKGKRNPNLNSANAALRVLDISIVVGAYGFRQIGKKRLKA